MVLHTRNMGPDAGTARLWIVVPVTMLSFFYMSILDYVLPLYFGALSTAAKAAGGSFPEDLYAQLVKYQFTPWFFMPLLAGLFSRRYGERRVWCFSQVAMVIVPYTLIVYPHPITVKAVAFWSGVTGAVLWISGVSLIQMVRPEKKGLSNGLLMGSIGLGSFIAPLCGRGVVYWAELQAHLDWGEWTLLGKKLSALERPAMTPQVDDFVPIFWFLVALKVVCGVLVGFWSQRPGQFAQDDESPRWDRTVTDLKRLIVNARFWALVIALCLLGGPVFQATNQYLPYRAEDLGLIQGAADQGWIWLKLLGTTMWIPGGLSIGLLAGRRAGYCRGGDARMLRLHRIEHWPQPVRLGIVPFLRDVRVRPPVHALVARGLRIRAYAARPAGHGDRLFDHDLGTGFRHFLMDRRLLVESGRTRVFDRHDRFWRRRCSASSAAWGSMSSTASVPYECLQLMGRRMQRRLFQPNRGCRHSGSVHLNHHFAWSPFNVPCRTPPTWSPQTGHPAKS